MTFRVASVSNGQIDFKGRDNHPFAELFRRHREVVWSVCYRDGENVQDAEDLTVVGFSDWLGGRRYHEPAALSLRIG